MSEKKFEKAAMNPQNPNWEKAIHRESNLYKRENDVRSEFARDYTRILHSLGYRRMKHKTQVFFNAAGNDHICTRIEHVAHVESVSSTIARTLGLNDELTKAIAVAHDIGHAPFGHSGEKIIDELTKKYLGNTPFWHEQNGVYFVDNLELLVNPKDIKENLDLTYAVRDGIISHCGEVDENGLVPRKEFFDLSEFSKAGMYNAATWEGCVVKLADKIAYLGRDIEDANRLGYFGDDEKRQLRAIAKRCNEDAVNTTVLTHSMIVDICNNSSPENGLCFSNDMHEILTEIKVFNYEKIYKNMRLTPYNKYAKLVIESLFEHLASFYNGIDTFSALEADEYNRHGFVKTFVDWLACYCEIDETFSEHARLVSANTANKKIYGKLETKEKYYRAIIDFISGMTDNYAVGSFNELLSC